MKSNDVSTVIRMKIESAIKKIDKKKKSGWRCEIAQHRRNPYRTNIRFFKQDKVGRRYDDDDEIIDLVINESGYEKLNKKCLSHRMVE